MPGYSGTPKKLGIKDGFRVALLQVPDDVTKEIEAALAKCHIVKPSSADLDFVFLFAQSRATLQRDLVKAAAKLARAGMLWIAWPKKSSGVTTDLDENLIRDRHRRRSGRH